ncbi:MAG: DPP IV N-terminal domain-containing protein [Anaerolineae bacterium]|nr:DPP IV N-terminal domain-containing protein [Anaerolineae bacterium]MCI0607972.1 DPP IV N-terminal domain-containing protein [Anaerolineae bacterium]
MESRKKFLSVFDAFLIGGLGCGVIGLCILMGGFVYVWQNPPVPHSTSTQVEFSGSPTVTTPFFDLSTPTIFPTIIPSLFPSPISGDGSSSSGKIVFTCFINQIDQICIMNADGSGRKQLTNFQATAFYASLSPDGGTIYFASRQSGTYEIYSMDINGNGLKRLTNNIGTLYAPELSPDGERIIFTNNGNGLWVMNADGSDPHALTFRDDIDPTWSPDGSMIAFASLRSGQRQLYTANANGKKVNQVTDLNNMGGRSTWSPDGTRLAFYRGPAGDRDIFIINIDGTGLERLTNGGDNLGPTWSPNGEWIAFTSFRDGNNEIYMIRPDGTGLTRLTNSTTSDWQPRWGR